MEFVSIEFESVHFVPLDGFSITGLDCFGDPLAFECDPFRVAFEFIPKRPISAARVFQSLDAPFMEYRVETGEITKLHGDRAWRSSDLLSPFDDFGVTTVKFAEGQTAIKGEHG